MGGTNNPGIGGTRRIATGIEMAEGSSKSEFALSDESESEVEAGHLVELDVRKDMAAMNAVHRG